MAPFSIYNCNRQVRRPIGTYPGEIQDPFAAWLKFNRDSIFFFSLSLHNFSAIKLRKQQTHKSQFPWAD
uniref:Uncharacterized protein n=1 Tax=Rhizophora mucronata TaxID=61149 RepID=A0A2P2JVE0_RHIMU